MLDTRPCVPTVNSIDVRGVGLGFYLCYWVVPFSFFACPKNETKKDTSSKDDFHFVKSIAIISSCFFQQVETQLRDIALYHWMKRGALVVLLVGFLIRSSYVGMADCLSSWTHGCVSFTVGDKIYPCIHIFTVLFLLQGLN